MGLLETINNYWQILAFIVGFVWWLGRLEFKTISNSKRISDLEGKDNSIDELKRTVVAIDAKLTVLIPGYTGKKQ